MLQHAISVSLIWAMAAGINPAASQGISRGASISGNGPMVIPATRVLVATPYPSAPADSMTAVAIGDALRNRLSNNLSSSDWFVIPRAEMNKNLTTWGYARDQLFQPESARQMVSAMQARMFVMTTLSKTADGRFVATSRLTGSSDDAGHVTKLTQIAGQTPQDFGNKVAEQIGTIFKAYPDAKSCNDQITVSKVKAAEGANRALKTVPGYGFPEYCLGLLEQLKDSVGAETERHFKAAIAGDPMSLKALLQIAVIHDRRHDSTGVVADYLQMLQVAPTNRELADKAVKVFRTYNRPDAAAAVVESQIKLDPSSPDWPELKGNLCAAIALSSSDSNVAKENFKCAYEAFLAVYNLDLSRADTLFYPRMLFVAGNRADSVLWTKRWIDKFPSSPDAYAVQLQLYMDAGQTDSALGVVKLLNAIDSTNVKPTLGIVQAWVKAGTPGLALQFLPYFKTAAETPRNQYAGLLINGVQPLVQAAVPADTNLIINLSQAIIDVAPTQTDFLAYGNYFLALGLRFPVADAGNRLRSAKNCEAAKTESTILARFEAALAGAAMSTNAGVSGFAKTTQTQLAPERKYVDDAVAKCP